MTLAPEQIAWADSHVGEKTVLRGAVDSWDENDDGTVTFTCTFTATPPPSEKQVAESEAAAKSQREEAQAAAAQRQLEIEHAERERVKAVVEEVLAAKAADDAVIAEK